MKAVEIIMIPVADQQKAKAFYLKLGFELLMEAPAEHGETWIQMGLPGQNVTISLAKFHGIIIETEDITAKMEALKEENILVEQMHETPWGKFAWLKDPDGNSLCLHQK
ncbi:VOC family protein [Fluviicola sp.]|uniref:VOC family protein n=1 Tax=Fluviicola sp. TaxID=1917219 RepID=UPI0031D699D9